MLRVLSKVPAVLLLLTAWVVAGVQPARAQVAVVTVQSIDAVIGDTKYLLKVAGREDLAKTLEGLIGSLSPDGKGFAGLDTKRPLGLYVNMPKAAGGMPTGAVFIPITKESEFLDFLTRLNVPHEKGEKGVYSAEPPTGQKVYFRFAHNYAHVSDNPATLEGTLINPATVIPAAHKKSLVAASVKLDQVPAEYRQMFNSHLDKALEEQKEKKPGESDAEFQGRQFGAKAARDIITMVAEQSKDVTFSLQIDQTKNQLAVDLALIPKPGSQIAASFKTFGAGRSMFSPLTKDSAANMLVFLPLTGELRDNALKVLEQSFQEGLKKAKSDKERQLGEKIYKAVLPTLKGEALDLGVVLHGPGAGEKYVVAGGLKVKDGKNLEKTVQEIVKEIPAADRKGVKLNHAKIGDVDVHLIVPNETPDEDVKKNLGNGNVYLAFRDDAVLFAVGEQGMDALKATLSGLKGGADSSTAPVQFEASIARLAPLAKEDQEKFVEAAKKVFAGDAKGKDKVRLSLQGGDVLRLRFDLNAEIVKLIVELAPIPGQ